MRKSYFQTDGLHLSYDGTQHIAYAVWNGFLNSQEFRESALKCVELIEEQAITRWLADNRKMKAIRQADQQWFVEEIMPRMLQSPLCRMATLVSEDVFNKMAVEQMIKRTGPLQGLALRDFEEEASALQWLLAPLPMPTTEQESLLA